MSQENIDLVRRCVQSVGAFWALLAEDVIWDVGPNPVPDIHGVYVGRAPVIEATRRYWGTWDDYRLDAEELIDAGSSVVVVVRERGRGKGSGTPFHRRWAQVWTFGEGRIVRWQLFEAGRIVRWQLFEDKGTALEAAGLSE
jgi:ketosteroid isomerase-like protein